jgi:coenzyme F420-reducing hydrogenase delta subunit
VRIIRVPCTGKVDILHLLEAFRSGADGVMVVGCLEGECHNLRGNLKARARVERAKRILDETRVGGARLEMGNVAASQAQAFVEQVRAMAERVEALGPSPVRPARARTGETRSTSRGDR